MHNPRWCRRSVGYWRIFSREFATTDMETRPGWIFSSRRWEKTASPCRKRTCCELRSFSKRFNRVVPYVNVEFCAPEQRLVVSRGGVFLQRKEKAFIWGLTERQSRLRNKWTACMSPCPLLEDSSAIKSKRSPYILHLLSLQVLPGWSDPRAAGQRSSPPGLDERQQVGPDSGRLQRSNLSLRISSNTMCGRNVDQTDPFITITAGSRNAEPLGVTGQEVRV